MSKVESMAADLALIAVHGRDIQDICHERAVHAGWWSDLGTGELLTAQAVQRMVPEKLLLIHSEISEACEAHRKGLKDDKLTERDGLEVELADALIRIYDLAGILGYNMGDAMAAKLRYNATRKDHTLEHRRRAGGKTY
jgi:NTP pyrophosphatase (non-canonical NTP hydrolase)